MSNEDQSVSKGRAFSLQPVFLSLISIAVVIGATFYIRNWEDATLLKNFKVSTQIYRQLLDSQLREIDLQLDSTKRFFEGSGLVQAGEFSAFISSEVANSKAIRAVSWAPRIESSQRAAFESSITVPGPNSPIIHSHETQSGDRHDTPTAQRPIHYPVFYTLSEDYSEGAIGYDLGSNPEALALLEQARDEGTVVPITGLELAHFGLTGNPGAKSNVNLIQPVYSLTTPNDTIIARRRSHLGFLLLQYDIGLALEATLAEVDPQGFDLYVVDIEADDGREIVYYHASRAGDGGRRMDYSEMLRRSDFIHQSPLKISGRLWRLIMVPVPSYFENNRQLQSWGVLIFGLLLSALISYVMFLNQRRTQTIRNVVKTRTRELEESENKQRAVITNIAEGIVTIDHQGIIESFNPAAEIMFGYSAEEAIGRNVNFLVPEDERGHHDQYIEKSNIHTSRIINQARDLFGQKKNGQLFQIELNVSNMPSEGKRRFIGIMHDISDRKLAEQQLKESKETLATAIENVPGGFLMVDNTNHIVLFNEKFQTLYPELASVIDFGVSVDEIVQVGVEKGMYAESRVHPEKWLKNRNTEIGTREFEFVDKLADGRWIAIATRKMADGSRVSIHTDISDLRNAQEEAHKANLAKSQFLSSMSHELRTPLNSIIGFGQLLKSDPDEPLSEDQTDSLSHILKSGQHLLSLIDEVLDLAKIESGTIAVSIEDVPVTDILDEALSVISTMAEDSAINIQVPDLRQAPQSVKADRTRVKQVLLNLLSNAIKYNRVDGTVSVSVENARPGFLRISVSDSGFGISETQQSKLFTPFNRLGAENTEVQGTGIGLVISKNLVESMNGTIGMDSVVGSGSTFWIELPLTSDDNRDIDKIIDVAFESISEPGHALNGKILYVEDNPDNLKLMTKIVARVEGLTMVSARTGEQGIELANTENPDVILLDIHLPGMNGYQVLEALGGSEKTKSISVIALSAAATEIDIKRGAESEFFEYLTKPIDVEAMLKVVKAALERPRERPA